MDRAYTIDFDADVLPNLSQRSDTKPTPRITTNRIPKTIDSFADNG
jgi:hypothetical protein